MAEKATIMQESELERIDRLLKPFLKEMQVDLVDLDIKQRREGVAIQVLVDRPKGGITLEECTRVNRKLHGEIEDANVFGEDFTLEVSSPGLDFPLTTEKDFRRVVGRDMRVHLREPVEGKVEHLGKLTDVTAEGITLVVKEQKVVIPLGHIHKGFQIIL